MTRSDEDSSDLSYEPVEGFLRNEALSRFSVVGVPTPLFDWEPLSERLPSASSSTEEGRADDQSPLIDSLEESSDEARSRLERRREKMITEVWSQLSEFYERNGYQALHKLRGSLKQRAKREQQRVDMHHERREYLSTLRADLKGCMNDNGKEATVERAFRENDSNTRAEWSRPHDHGNIVKLRLPEQSLEERGIDPDNLRRYPWPIEMDIPLEEAFMKLHRKVESEKERILELGDFLQYLRLRLRLLGRKLWTIDLGLSTEEPPTRTTIPERFKGKERPVQYCCMILSVIEECGPKWPSQSELSEVLEDYYDLDSIPVQAKSAVDYASEFIREEFSDDYQAFRPDFYRILQDRSDLFESLAREMETELLDQIDSAN